MYQHREELQGFPYIVFNWIHLIHSTIEFYNIFPKKLAIVTFFFGYLIIISLYVFTVESIIINLLTLVLLLSIFKSSYDYYTENMNDKDGMKGNFAYNISSLQKNSGEKYEIFRYSKNSPNQMNENQRNKMLLFKSFSQRGNKIHEIYFHLSPYPLVLINGQTLQIEIDNPKF